MLVIDCLQGKSGIRNNSWGLLQWSKGEPRAFTVEEGFEKCLEVESTALADGLIWSGV